MPFDFVPNQSVTRNRSAGGAMCNAAGHSSELQVIARYEDKGAQLLDQNWRGSHGEIDLIFEQSGEIIFVEVKSSRSHAAAASHLQQAQIARIYASAEEYIGTLPTGSLTPLRIDVALVDRGGSIEVLQNALIAA